jgi:glutaredoxin-like protein
MAVLNDKQREQLKDAFGALVHPVAMVMFTQEFECQNCRTVRELLEEIADISDKITVSIKDFVADGGEAENYGVDKIPAIILLGDRDYGIRFFGVPGGYEFTTLIKDILRVSKREHGLSDDIIQELENVNSPVHLQVMVSATCPYCPAAVSAAHAFAMARDVIRADMIETATFPHLVNKYNVQGVPHTVINEKESVAGAVSEMELAKKVVAAVA